MKCFYMTMLGAVACLVGCGGGGGGSESGEGGALVVPSGCTSAEMSFVLGNSSEGGTELKVTSMTLTESSPGSQTGTVTMSCSFTSLYEEIDSVTLTGEWSTVGQDPVAIVLSKVEAGGTAADGVKVDFEASNLRLRATAPQLGENGLPLSRETSFINGAVKMTVGNYPQFFMYVGEEAVRIKYHY